MLPLSIYWLRGSSKMTPLAGLTAKYNKKVTGAGSCQDCECDYVIFVGFGVFLRCTNSLNGSAVRMFGSPPFLPDPPTLMPSPF